jgi:type II secretory pathway component PulC
VSIIYDALQKTQRNRSGNKDINLDHINRKIKFLDRGLLIAIILLLALVIYAYHPLVTKHLHGSTKKPVIATAPKTMEAAAPSNMVLNGVLMSDNNQTALINNQFYHLGDSVNGMKIINIELNNVKLQQGNQIVVLRTSA